MNLLLNTPPELYFMLIGAIIIGLIAGMFQSFIRSLTKKKPKSKTPNPKTHEKELKKLDKIYGKFSLAKVDKMTGQDFEKFTEKLFRVVYCDRISKTEGTPVTGDQGCDIILHLTDGSKLGIQCKRYKDNVGNTAVQNIVTAKKIYGLDLLYVVTNSNFTPSALEAARPYNVQMIDREELKKLIDIYNAKITALHTKK